MDQKLESSKRAVLDAALPIIPFDGWTDSTLSAAVNIAVSNGTDEIAARQAFSNNPKKLLTYFITEIDKEMIMQAGQRGLASGSVRTIISSLIFLRLEILAPHREAVRRALSIQLLPGWGINSMRELFCTVDLIWKFAGDSSTDFNFYTKRLLLGMVYSTTLIRWLDDKSDDFSETQEFLDRRIADTLRLGKIRRRAEKYSKYLPSPVPFLVNLRYGKKKQ